MVDQADLDAVARQLGREPRGVLEIAYRCPNGEPGVVKTTPRLPDGTPFPTLYYLTHPVLTERDAVESLGTTFSGGGMPERVKCLHVVMAHSLAKGPGVNPFGDEALELLAVEPAMAGILDKGRWAP